jgi:hypothetical protein
MAASSAPPKVVVPFGVITVRAGSLMVSVASSKVPVAVVKVPLPPMRREVAAKT